MALSDRQTQPQLEPATEKVRGGRRAAIVVGAVTVLVVGALIWKPWDSPNVAPLKTTIAAVPTSSPIRSEPATVSPVVVQPSPGLTQLGEAPPFYAPDDLGSVALTTESGPFVECTYGQPRQSRMALRTMTIAAPIVTTGVGVTDGHVQRVDWHVEIEVNSLSRLFSESWQVVQAARPEQSGLAGGRVVTFNPKTVSIPVQRFAKSSL